MFKDVAELIKETQGTNNIGDAISEKTYREIYVMQDKIWRAEFYSAYAVGLKPSLSLTMQSSDYEKEKLIRFEKEEYRIIRVDQKNGDLLTLICEGVVNVGTT